MINLYNYRERRLTDIADVVRTTKGTVYPKGTIYIQVSACSKTADNPFKLLMESSELESKYAVVLPKVDVIPEYLLEVLGTAAPKWRHRYIGTNINISMDCFKFLIVTYHRERETQQYVLDALKPFENVIEQTKAEISATQEFKQWSCDKMFCKTT